MWTGIAKNENRAHFAINGTNPGLAQSRKPQGAAQKSNWKGHVLLPGPMA